MFRRNMILSIYRIFESKVKVLLHMKKTRRSDKEASQNAEEIAV